MTKAKRHDAAAPSLSSNEGEDGPERRCIVTRASQPAEGLIRFVRAPDETVVPDLKRTLPGRGAWVTATRAMVNEAVRRKAFARAFKAPALADEGLAAQVEGLIKARALESLSLANKAGLLIAGFSKVEAAIRAREIMALIHAEAAGHDGVRRLAALAKGLDLKLERISAFSGDELDLALGRSNVIHAALKTGDITRLAIERARALERYRGAAPEGGAAQEQVHAGEARETGR